MLKTANKISRYALLVSTLAMFYFLPIYIYNLVTLKTYEDLGSNGMIPWVWLSVLVVRVVVQSLVDKQAKQQAVEGENNA